MAKFNTKTTTAQKVARRPDVTTNEEGGLAFKVDKETELALHIMSTMVGEPGFYKGGSELDAELKALIAEVDASNPEFILKLALYARTNMYLRSAPIMLCGEHAVGASRGKVPNASAYIAATIQRADEMTELLAYVAEASGSRGGRFKGKTPMVVKRAVADAFCKFDGYQLAKYNRDGDLTLKDVMFITHPKPKDEVQAKVFADIASGTLASPDTWEVVISTKGSTKENWEAILPKMGYMAVLRNLRNMIEKKVDTGKIVKRLVDANAIAKSKQFPYRFYSAYKEIRGSSKVLGALSDAADMSVANVPEFAGTTFVTCDTSRSMDSTISAKSKINLKEAGCMFGAIVSKKSEDAITSVFATDHIPVALNPRDSLFASVDKMLRADTHGCGTDAYKVMDWLNKNKVFVDRIVLFSDMQCYDSRARGASIYAGLVEYKRNINPKVFVYSFDLAAYGTTQFPKDEPRVMLGGGFSDKILNFIPMFERSRADMMADIRATGPS